MYGTLQANSQTLRSHYRHFGNTHDLKRLKICYDSTGTRDPLYRLLRRLRYSALSDSVTRPLWLCVTHTTLVNSKVTRKRPPLEQVRSCESSCVTHTRREHRSAGLSKVRCHPSTAGMKVESNGLVRCLRLQTGRAQRAPKKRPRAASARGVWTAAARRRETGTR